LSDDSDGQHTYPSNADSITGGAALQPVQMSIAEMVNMLRNDEAPQELIIESEQVVFLGGTTVFCQSRAPAHSANVIRQAKETIGMLELCLATPDFLLAQTVIASFSSLLGDLQDNLVTYYNEKDAEIWKNDINTCKTTLPFGYGSNFQTN
jgi:hypothetical protein